MLVDYSLLLNYYGAGVAVDKRIVVRERCVMHFDALLIVIIITTTTFNLNWVSYSRLSACVGDVIRAQEEYYEQRKGPSCLVHFLEVTFLWRSKVVFSVVALLILRWWSL